MKTHFTSGGELDKLLRRGVSNVCSFFKTRAAGLYLSLGTSLLFVCLILLLPLSAW